MRVFVFIISLSSRSVDLATTVDLYFLGPLRASHSLPSGSVPVQLTSVRSYMRTAEVTQENVLPYRPFYPLAANIIPWPEPLVMTFVRAVKSSPDRSFSCSPSWPPRTNKVYSRSTQPAHTSRKYQNTRSIDCSMTSRALFYTVYGRHHSTGSLCFDLICHRLTD